MQIIPVLLADIEVPSPASQSLPSFKYALLPLGPYISSTPTLMLSFNTCLTPAVCPALLAVVAMVMRYTSQLPALLEPQLWAFSLSLLGTTGGLGTEEGWGQMQGCLIFLYLPVQPYLGAKGKCCFGPP